MDKEQWLAYLESVHPAEIEMGLRRVAEVADRLDLRRPASQVILVGGTNGKGTTTALLRNLLAAQGKTSGLYNSPHIHEYNERVSLCADGQTRLISDAELIASFEAIEKGRGDIPLTYFEFGTLAAIWQIKQWQPDVAILEIGLGGRLDACNIVEPDLSIVTSVGLDHQDWLGDTLDLIGAEKAAIGRAGKPLICGQLNVSQGFIDTAQSIGSNTCYQGKDFSASRDATGIVHYQDAELSLEFSDYHVPYWNIASAIAGLKQLGMLPALDIIPSVIADTRVAGRLSHHQVCFEGKNLNLVLDVAHNPQAAGYIAGQLRGQCNHCVLAMLNDKDPVGVVAEFEYIDHWCLAGIDGFRGQSGEALKQKLPSQLQESAIVAGSVSDALEQSCQSLQDGDTLLVIGSFLTVSAAQDWVAANAHN